MKIGIIGYGHLGKAFVRGLVLTGFPQSDMVINARTEKTRESVRKEFADTHVTGSKEELVNIADVVVIIVEPVHAKEVLSEIKAYDLDGKTLISFMAGITMAEIRNALDDKQNVVKLVRVMPNIAIQDGKGVMGITCEDTEDEALQEVLVLFSKLGYVLKLEEDSLNDITVTAASGLAFVASLMDSYRKACNTLFDNGEISKEITLRVFENVIDMVKKEDCSFEDIVYRIATKGGTTEAGMKHLNPEQITKNLENCMEKSYEKARNII